MKKSVLLSAVGFALMVSPAVVEAKGCIRGAIAGGVAGHYAGHHAIAGAMGGCVAGHMYYKHKAKVAHKTTHVEQTR